MRWREKGREMKRGKVNEQKWKGRRKDRYGVEKKREIQSIRERKQREGGRRQVGRDKQT